MGAGNTASEGLTEEAAAEKRKTFGPNQAILRRERAWWWQLLARFRNPLVLLLIAASLISALTGDQASVAIIALVVIISVTLDFVQEHRAGRAAERLKESVALRVSVLRPGGPRDVPAVDLVPGDVVLLAAGDLVPADGEVLEARDFFVNQALLTGEPYPVEKHARPAGGGASALFMGTAVISGSARMLVTTTGPRTAFGQIGVAVSARPPATAFEVGTRSFGLLIVRLATLMVLFVILVNTFAGRGLRESFLFAVALAVGLTPELLPMVVSVTLARGAVRMARRKVIVKRLAAIHDLGAMTVLCTDKTGTLTEARIRLERHVDAHGRASDWVLRLAYLNSRFETGMRSPLDEAILRHQEVDVTGWEKIDEVPFDFERRRISVLVGRAGEAPLLVVKGAAEEIVRLSGSYEEDGPEGRVAPLDDTIRAEIRAEFESLGRAGFRVLGIAWKREEPGCRHAAAGDERDLVFAGLAAFEDPPKAGAARALAQLSASGIAVKVVTGDHELPAEHVCRALGLPVAGVLTGAEIERLDDDALVARTATTTIFSRVNPAQKNRILLACKRRGEVVGYLGDGINDAPALHSADVGISVDGAVDVAKEAADLILLEHDIGVLHEGVIEGRRTFANVMKYVMMGTSSNFGNMFSMAGASLLLPFLPMLPVQILLNNLLYDISEIPIPTDDVDADFVARPRRWDMGFVRRFMLTLGPLSSAFDFLTFYVLLAMFHADQQSFRTGWFIESIATQVLVIFVIRTRGAPWRNRPGKWLWVTACLVLGVAMTLPFLPAAGALGFVPVPGAFFAVLVLLLVVYLGLAEMVKRWFYRRWANGRG